MPKEFHRACGVDVTAWGCDRAVLSEALAFYLKVSKVSFFFFLQTTLGTRVTFVGKNISITAASKSTETCTPWMVSTVLMLRYPS